MGAVNIHLAAVEVLGKKGRSGSKQDETQFTQKIAHLGVPAPPPIANVLFFAGFFMNLTRFWIKLRVLVLCFPDFTEKSSMRSEINIGDNS